MNKETYETLKRVVNFTKNNIPYYVDKEEVRKVLDDIKQVEIWIEEHEKEVE